MAFSFLHQKQKSTDPQEAAEKVIAKAHRKSEQLLEEAVKEAELIISQTKGFRDELQKNVKEDVAYQAAQFAQEYHELLPEIKKIYQDGINLQLRTFDNQLREISAEVKKNIQNRLDDLSNLLKEQALQEFASIQKELNAYKHARMVEIDESVRQTVKKAVLAIVGKTISLTEHEELIKNALEKAKNDGLFAK